MSDHEQLDADPQVPEPPEAPLAQRRFFGGWFVLAVSFVFLIVLPLVRLDGSDKEPGFNSTELEQRLKIAVLGKEFAEAAKSNSTQSSSDELEKEFKNIRKEAFPFRESDIGAAKFTLAVGHEVGLTADPGALKLLEKSKSAVDRDFAKIYASDKLDPNWVASIRSSLPATFLGKVVLTHAYQKSGQPDVAEDVVTTRDAIGVGVVFIGALFALAVGIIVLIASVLNHFAGSKPAVGHPYAGLTVQDADRLAWRMAVFLVIFVFVPSLLILGLRGRVNGDLLTLIGEIAVLVVFAMACATPVLGVADPLKKILGSTASLPKLIGIGILGFFANLPIVMVLALVTQQILRNAPAPTHPISEQIGAGADPVSIALMYIVAAVMAPILEELSFRGLLFPALGRFMKPGLAMVVSGLLFGMIHPQGPVLWPSLAAIGAMSAYLAYRTGSLVPSMVMHAVHNASILTLSLVILY